MGATILVSTFLVLELGAIVIYDGIKIFLTHVWRGEVASRWGGGGSGHFTKAKF